MNNLDQLKHAFAKQGCDKLYIKKLAANDNSKNQVYLAGSFDVLNILTVEQIAQEDAGDWNRERFKASLNFYWIKGDGSLIHAPNAQLILYPKYPEVCLSGFLKGAKGAPSDLMAGRMDGRLLFIGVGSGRRAVYAHVVDERSAISNEFRQTVADSTFGVFAVLGLAASKDSRSVLLDEMRRIHYQGWIDSKRLSGGGEILPCNAPNCGGYTLEAELGISPNGYAEPDFMGWEIKQFAVRNFSRTSSSVITLMTPEPSAGYYRDEGAAAFLRKYGYADRRGREDRINFGGIHRAGILHSTTSLTLHLIGYDTVTGKIRNSSGRIALVDPQGCEAASWDFVSLLKHWNKKHHQACYVPSMNRREPMRQYCYGSKVILGEHTDFLFFLGLMARGHIYYDPGIKMEKTSSAKPEIKKRSQFRIKSGNLPELYRQNSVVDLMV